MRKVFVITLLLSLLGCSRTPTPVPAPKSGVMELEIEEFDEHNATEILVAIGSCEYGEKIYIDDVLIEEETLLLNYPLEEGWHTITVESSDPNRSYVGIARNFEKGKRYQIDIDRKWSTYEIKYTGKISNKEFYFDLYSMQDGETVYIDNEKIDQVTPIIGYKLPVGKHSIRVESKDERLYDYAVTQPFEGGKYYYISINNYKRDNYTYIE